MLATRIRKARGNSLCGLCDTGIRIGQQIGKLPGIWGWSHTSCILERQRDTVRAPDTSADGAQ